MPTDASLSPSLAAAPSRIAHDSTSQAAIGVLIATYNRAGTLLECLRHLERQTCREFEVVVVVDGSSDSTMDVLREYERRAPFPMRYVFQANHGPAHARNNGVRLNRAPICLLLGDDIFATPELVARHLEFHRSHPEENAAGLGLTQWSRNGQTVTPLMRWLDDDGVQFAYGRLLRGETPSWKHLYSSNLSMKTSLLAENPYQEIFRAYGMEDIELGYRLAKEKGLTVTFLREAVGYHLHPTDYRQTIRRAELAGAATFTFAQLWPEQRWHAPRSALKRLALRVLMEPSLVLPALTWAAGLATRLRCPNPLLKLVLGLHLRLGYQRAQRGAA